VPLTVEKQVLILYVATSGMLDAVPVGEVRRFEREFLQFTETKLSLDTWKSIATKKALDDGIKAEVKTAVDAIQRNVLQAAVAAAAK